MQGCSAPPLAVSLFRIFVCVPFAIASSSSAGVGNETSYTWEGVSTAACDEILWGLLTLRRAARDSDAFEAVNISLKVQHYLPQSHARQ